VGTAATWKAYPVKPVPWQVTCLGKLIVLYDETTTSRSMATPRPFTEVLCGSFEEAYGW
jgi:hypothetical protein